MFLVEFALGVLAVPVALLLLHYVSLAIASLWPGRDPGSRVPSELPSFMILIPACNEEMLVARTLRSVAELDYPHDRVDVVVLVDNCTDRTAEIVGKAGVEAWMRNDPDRRGKGQALRWAFRRCMASGRPDAFVVIDADTVVDRLLLKAFATRLAEGHDSIQAYHDVLDPESSVLASLSYVGCSLSRTLRDGGRERLGWCCSLVGNGMCFSSSLLDRFGWEAVSLTEDLEYQMILFDGGVRTRFAREVRVKGEAVRRLSAYRDQRTRWDRGRVRLRQRFARRLLSRAISEKNASAFDLFIDLLAPPYTLLGGALFCGFGASLALTGGSWVAWSWGSMCAVFVVYILAGLAAAGAPARVYLNLLCAPLAIPSRLRIALRRDSKQEGWGEIRG